MATDMQVDRANAAANVANVAPINPTTNTVTSPTGVSYTQAPASPAPSGGAPAPVTPAVPPKGTVIGQPVSVKNADGSFTIVTTIADGNGGYTSSSTQSGASASDNGVPQSAKDVVNKFLSDAGMSALSDNVWSQWKTGTTAPQIIDYVRSTPEYAARFPAMAALDKRGEHIDEATYIAKEEADKDLLKQYGIPSGIFDTHDYLGSLMVNNVTSQDLQQRLIAAQNTINSLDPNVKQYAKDTFGLDSGSLMAWAADPTKALPVIQQQAQAMQIGGAAVQAGFAGGLGSNGQLSVDQATALANAGVTQSQAQQGFVNLGQMGQYA